MKHFFLILFLVPFLFFSTNCVSGSVKKHQKKEPKVSHISVIKKRNKERKEKAKALRLAKKSSKKGSK